MMTESELSSPTSTSSSGDLSPKKMDDKTSYRKSNKPMMEKKRRARINSCLSQLKALVLQAMKKDNSQYSKLEKADILELTVKHLKNVQRCQANSMTQVPDAMNKYRAGFNECANEVIRYLGESQGVNDDARTRILTHLASILSPINALSLQPAHTPILPAPSPVQQHHQQQQQHHLQQLQLQQQQQQQAAYLTAHTQSLSIDTNNNMPAVSGNSAFLAPSACAMDVKHVISGSPTAFQSPIATGVNAPTGLQLPCIATAAMATTPLQLVPSTLPSGQVALVLAPQAIPAMNVYAAPQGNRLPLTHESIKVEHDAINSQPHHLSKFEECKARLTSNESPVALVTKPLRSHRTDNPTRPLTPYSTRPTSSSALAATTLSTSSQGSTPIPKQTEEKRPSGTTTSTHVPRTTATAIIINNSSISSNNTNNNDMSGDNVVRTTSTWRPW